MTIQYIRERRAERERDIRERRAEREREFRELRARIQRIRERKIGDQVSSQQQQVVQPSTTPAIPASQQARVQADLNAQRTAFTPLGDIGVGAKSAAPENRGKPEFGSFLGSGVLENMAGAALPALENVQKLNEAVGGTALQAAGALTPGDLFGFESELKRVTEEKGAPGFFNAAGQAQNLAEAFRNTDLPSTQVSLPGQGIPLPGGRKIDDIDIGVKGAIELIPEIVVGVATGGGSAAGGLGQRAIISTANSLGYDIARGAVKVSSKAGRASVASASKAPEVIGRIPRGPNISQISKGIDRLSNPDFAKSIQRLPNRMKGPITAVLAASNPVRVLDTSRAATKGMLINAKGLDQIDKDKDLAMAIFVKRLNAVDMKLPHEDVETFTGKVPGVPLATNSVGQIGNTGIPNIDDGVLAKGAKGEPTRKIPYQYNEVMENFFVGENADHIPRYLDKAGVPTSKKTEATNPEWLKLVMSRTQVAKEFGGANIGSWSPVLDRYLPDVRVTRGGDFDPVAAEFATYVRHWQDNGKAVELEYVTRSGNEIKKTEKLDRASSFYSPRNNNGNYLLEDADIANGSKRVTFSGTTPGKSPKALRQRELRNDEVRELIADGQYSLSSPMRALAEHTRSMYKAAWDEQLKKFLKSQAKRKGTGVIRIAESKNKAKAAIGRAIKGTNVRPKTIDAIDKQFPATAEVMRDAMALVKGSKLREDVLNTLNKVLKEEVDELLDGTWLPTRAGAVSARAGAKGQTIPRADRMPAYTGLYFEDKAEVDRLVKQHFPNDNLGSVSRFTKVMAETGDIIRLGRTGFDFGFWMIHGLPALGFAVAKTVSPGMAVKATETTAGISHHALGRALVKSWVKSVPKAFKDFMSQERMMLSLADDIDILNEAIGNGLQIGKTSTDAFQAIQGRGTILRAGGTLGRAADSLIMKSAAPFERAFVAPGDYIRKEFYKILRPVGAQGGQEGLEGLAASLNNMTGALSSSALGIHPTLQNVERGVIAFSARYTRASLALLTDVFKGGIQGRIARESMAGMLGLGMVTYIATVEAINLAGGKQELHLDPTKGSFMTVNIAGDNIGVGGFWTQFAKVTSKTLETAWDEDAREAFLGDDTIRTNPLIRWVRGRSAPTAGIGVNVLLGEDYLGRDIEGPMDWTKHVSRQLTPIWLEAAVIGDPKRTGVLGLAGEIAGGRIRPLSNKEIRRDLRDSIAQDVYDKDWVDLNGLERDRINAGSVEMSLSAFEELQSLNETILSESVESGDEDDLVIEKYHRRHTDIEDEWNENLAEGIELLGSHPGVMDLEKFRHMYLSSANAIRRSKLEELNDPEGEFGLAITHFKETAEHFGEDNPEDIAYNEYITNILATDDFDIPGGYDYDAKDAAIKEFQATWGNEVYAYVQERFATGRNIPELVSEFWQGRKQFEYYWRDVDEATLATMPNAAILEPAYKEWSRASENRRAELEETVPHLKALVQKVSRVKGSMRERNALLDAWLFRWGYTQTLSSPENKFSPDGVDDARDFWRDPKPMRLEVFGIQSGVAI